MTIPDDIKLVDTEDLLEELLKRGELVEVCKCLCERQFHDDRMCHVCWDGHTYEPVYRRPRSVGRSPATRQLEHIKFLLHTLLQPGVGLFEDAHNPFTWYVLHNTQGGGIIKIDLPDELQDILNSDEGQSWTRA